MNHEQRCAAASLDRGDDLAGTASTVARFLLVEHPGPWGVAALRDARMPRRVRDHIRVPGVRTLLIRRHGRDRSRGVRVLQADVRDRTLRGAVVPTLEDLLDLDLADPGTAWGDPVDAFVGVCTHGRHDVCCAERGRPVAAEFARLAPEVAWEVSHIGGDRFAANVLVLPQGLYYGRVETEHVSSLVATLAQGTVRLDLLRGRTDVPMAGQYAEIALRRRLGLTGLDDARVVGRDGDAWIVAAGEQRHRLRVELSHGPPAPLTCRGDRAAAVPQYRADRDDLARLDGTTRGR